MIHYEQQQQPQSPWRVSAVKTSSSLSTGESASGLQSISSTRCRQRSRRVGRASSPSHGSVGSLILAIATVAVILAVSCIWHGDRQPGGFQDGDSQKHLSISLDLKGQSIVLRRLHDDREKEDDDFVYSTDFPTESPSRMGDSGNDALSPAPAASTAGSFGEFPTTASPSMAPSPPKVQPQTAPPTSSPTLAPTIATTTLPVPAPHYESHFANKPTPVPAPRPSPRPVYEAPPPHVSYHPPDDRDDPFSKENDDEIKKTWADKETKKPPESLQDYVDLAKSTADEVLHDRNVAIVSAVLGVVALMAVLCTAQQMIENPDGCCAMLCRCSIGCARIICYPCRKLCCWCSCCGGSRARDRRTHEILGNNGHHEYGAYSHDLELT